MGSIPFTPGSAIFPDGSANNLFPALQRVKSSAGAPGLYFQQLNFDATNEEWCTFQTIWPADYTGSPVAKVTYKMASATSNGVAWDVRIGATSDGDSQDQDAQDFGSSNVNSGTVPGTAGHIDVISVTLTNADSVAAGDFVVVRLARATGNGGDTATGDAEFLGLSIEYS
jgi:hypothetical protein